MEREGDIEEKEEEKEGKCVLNPTYKSQSVQIERNFLEQNIN